MQTPQMGQTTHDILFSKMLGQQVKSASGKKIASLQDLVINPNTGRIRFAVLGRGGFFGLGQKLLPVPWQKVTESANGQMAVNITQRKLNSAPQIAGNYSNLNTPGFLNRIDQYYSVPPPAVGGAEIPSGTQQGSSSKSWSKGHNEHGTSGHQGQQNQVK
jgi:sporulation protein YlmC with PRC-barrel domain